MLSIMSLPAYATSLDADLSAAEDSAGKQVLMNAWTCAKLGKACAEFQKSNGTFTVQGFAR